MCRNSIIAHLKRIRLNRTNYSIKSKNLSLCIVSPKITNSKKEKYSKTEQNGLIIKSLDISFLLDLPKKAALPTSGTFSFHCALSHCIHIHAGRSLSVYGESFFFSQSRVPQHEFIRCLLFRLVWFFVCFGLTVLPLFPRLCIFSGHA